MQDPDRRDGDDEPACDPADDLRPVGDASAGPLRVDGTIRAHGGDIVLMAPQVDVGASALLQAIEPYRADRSIQWQEAEPTLEDIFIHLMGKARDNALDA